MPWTTQGVPDLAGRVAVVTGANGGLGKETAAVLAAHGAHVVVAARDQGKAAAAVDEISLRAPGGSLEVVALDLASQVSVRRAAEQVLGTHRRVDLLVNNAGLMATPEGRTQDGHEMQFGVNHLGHWTLTALLLPALLAAPAARVVTVTSVAHLGGRPVDPGRPGGQGRYDPWAAYATSKLANYHFGLGLHRLLDRAGAPAASLVAHPGLTHSDLQTRTVASGGAGWSALFWAWAARTAGMGVAAGALPQLRAATDPGARGGQLYGPLFGTAGPPVRQPLLRRADERTQKALWELSERATGVALRL